VEQYNSNIY